MSESSLQVARTRERERRFIGQVAAWALAMTLMSDVPHAADNPNVKQVPAGKVATQQELKALEGQVVALRREIALLRRRLDERDAREKAASADEKEADSNVADLGQLTGTFVPPWRKLAAGMAYSDVIALLGTPTKVNAGVVTEVFYSDKGFLGAHLTFSSNKLISWTPPE